MTKLLLGHAMLEAPASSVRWAIAFSPAINSVTKDVTVECEFRLRSTHD